MASRKVIVTAALLAGFGVAATPLFASDHDQARRHSHGQARGHYERVVPHAVSRPPVYVRRVPRRTVIVPRAISPRVIGVVPFRPYVYRPGFSVRLGFGHPYPYGYVAPPPAYVNVVPGQAYGGVRVQGAPPDAQIFADGYYMGVADDFDGTFQHMNLEAGAHRIEVRANGFEPIVFDVNVQPGQTITYRADQFAPIEQ